MTATAKRPTQAAPTRRSFAGKPRTALSPIQRVIRDNDGTAGPELVDAAIAIARARREGKAAVAAAALAGVREGRRPWVERIVAELVEAGTTGSTAREREDAARAARVRELLRGDDAEIEDDLCADCDAIGDPTKFCSRHRDNEAAS